MDSDIDITARREIQRLAEKSTKEPLSMEEADLLLKYTKIVKDNDGISASDKKRTDRPYVEISDAVLLQALQTLKDAGLVQGPKSVEQK